MKKLIACAVLIGATCAFAEDSYLFWMIDPNATFEGGTLPAADPVRVKIAAIKGPDWTYGGGNYLMLNAYSGGTVGDTISFVKDGKIQPTDVRCGSPLFAAIPTDYTGMDWTYYVELYNDSGIFARSDSLPYSAESIVAIAGMGRPGTLWNVKAFMPAAVPEPSSGLLLLLGVAGLALRRRKQIAA